MKPYKARDHFALQGSFKNQPAYNVNCVLYFDEFQGF